MKKMLAFIMAIALVLGCVPAGLAQEEHEPVTITYGGDYSYFLMLEWIEEFEKEYPWITVEMARGVYDIPDLTMAAANNEMPDIFRINNVTEGMQNKWLLDLTEYCEADPDWQYYPQWLREVCSDNQGRIRALCNNLYMQTVLVNLSLLEENNIPAPDYDWTVEEWGDVLRGVSGTGSSLGVGNLNWYQWWLPSQMGNPDIGYLGYNTATEQWDFGEEWLASVNAITELYDDGVCLWDYMDNYIGMPWLMTEATEEERTSLFIARDQFLMDNFGTNDWQNYWPLGKFAVYPGCQDGLWDETNPAYTGFDWDIYPHPVGGEDVESRAVVSPLLLGVSSTTEHPYECYLFTKWITYSIEGYEREVEIMNNYSREDMMVKYSAFEESQFPTTLTNFRLSPSTDPRVKDIFTKMYEEEMPGLTYLVERVHNNPVVDGWISIPNFDPVDALFFDDLSPKIYTGKATPASVAPEYEKIANRLLAEGLASYGE